MNNYKNLIILDWDDTLFPTSWTVSKNMNLGDEKIKYKYMVFFSKLDMVLYQLLSKLIKYGKVIIVTNAVSKWVYVSSNMLPNSQNIIKKNIIIMSARDLFQEQYPNQISMWKKLMFKELVNQYFVNHKMQNIISVGDADYEFDATVDLYDEHSVVKNKLLKTIRFIRSPSFDDLIDELQVLDKCIEKIVTSIKHHDLTFKN